MREPGDPGGRRIVGHDRAEHQVRRHQAGSEGRHGQRALTLPGRVFFTADTHFGHAGARALYRRPFESVPVMDRALIEAWNATVRPEDTVWHLGDFAVRHPDPAGVLAGLHGTKHLVFGNNDPPEVRALAGWASVGGLVELVVGGVTLILCHYALRTWPGLAKGALNLHGHSHGRLKPMARQFDVGVDAREFRPVEIGELQPV